MRGYTTLRILDALMERIKVIEVQEDSACLSSTCPLQWRKRRNGSTTPEYLPCHYFDYIAGTSSGGSVKNSFGCSKRSRSTNNLFSILAIMLSRLRMSPKECIEAYRNLVSKVFGHPRIFHLRRIPLPRNKFHHKHLEAAIQAVVKDFDHTASPNAAFRQPCQDMCRT